MVSLRINWAKRGTRFLTSGGTGVLLDVAALADEAVLGLGAGKTTLGLGPELRIEARHSASNQALWEHGAGNPSAAIYLEVVRRFDGGWGAYKASNDEAIELRFLA